MTNAFTLAIVSMKFHNLTIFFETAKGEDVSMLTSSRVDSHDVSRSPRHRPLRQRLWRNRYVYLMLLPVVLYFLLFKYWPMYWLRISLYDYKLLRGFDGSKFVGLKHYLKFFNGSDFWVIIRNTISLNLLSLLLVFPMPIFFALLLNEFKHLHFKKFVQTVSYLPYFISITVLVSMINTFLSPSVGTLNMLLKSLGSEPVYFLGNAKYFRWIYVFSSIWQGMGWNAIVYLSALTGIDSALYEAAIVDGAGRMRQAWHVTLPGIRNTIVIMLILQVGRLMSVGFEKVFLLQNPLNTSVSEVISTYVYKQGIVNANVSYSTAVGFFNSVISFALILISNGISKKYSEVSLW